MEKDYANNPMLIRRAIIFATIAHQHQYRKGTKIPYIVHPYEVAQILTEANAAEEMICAGLLHDVVEDTDFTLEDISDRFGAKVAQLVSDCSENKAWSWERRKEATINFLKHEASEDVLLISCADKLSNLRSSKQANDEVGRKLWERFNRGYDKQKWYYTGLNEAFKRIDQWEMVKEFHALYQCVFNE